MSNKINYTPSQQQIINERKRNLLVSANAGSGKTSVMIERVVSLIEEGKTSLNKILVLTFTNNSANDMKEKLYKKLSQSSSVHCKRAVFDVVSADISNIHQFCKKLIQKYFYVCGVDPAFSVVSESEALVLKDNAFETVVKEEFFSNSEKFSSLLDENFEKRNLNSIKTMILQIYQHLNVLDNPKQWLEDIASENYSTSIEENKAIQILISDAKAQLNYFLTEFLAVKSHITQFYQDENFEDVKSNITCLAKITSEKNNKAFLESLFALSAIKTDYRKKDDIKAFRDDCITPLINNYKKSLEKIKKSFGEQSVAEIENFLLSSKVNVQYLCYLASQFSKKYQEIKAEKFLLDFNDLEKKAFEILSDENISKIIQEKYDYCFIDEYQDINTLQEAILNLVSKKSKYFGVGDAKQAIYGFRLCSPEIFIEKFEDFKKDNQNSIATSLTKNFRSNVSILNFCNKIFSTIMTEQTCGIDYESSALFDTDNLSKTCGVEILIAKSQKKQKQTLEPVYSVENHVFEDEEETNNAFLEASLCANEIATLVNQGEKLNDISILSRSKSAKFVQEFFKQLSAFNIPVSAFFNYNLLESEEVLVLHNLFKLINNFKDDIVLAKVMLSPLFKFSNSELFEIRKRYNAKFFHESVLESRQDSEKVNDFINLIEKLSIKVQNLSLYDFAKQIIQDFDFEFYANENYEIGKHNLQKFLGFLEGFSLTDLTTYCQLTSNDIIEIKNDSQSGNENCVSLNTIHSAKGLEYKYVFLVGSERNIAFDDKTKQTLVSKELGVGIKAQNALDEKAPTPVYNAIKLSNKKQEFAEEIRLLYVALTRAKEKLFVVGALDEKIISELVPYKDEKEILSSKSYIELILKSLSKSEIEKLKNKNNCEIFYNDMLVAKATFVEETALSKNALFDEDKILLGTISQEKKEDLEKKLVAYWETVNIQNQYLKNNVTALVGEKNEISYANNMFSEEKTVASVGTLYHETFAKLKYDGLEKELIIPSEIKKEYVEKYVQSNFYKSLIGKNILKEIPFLLYEKLPEFLGESDNRVLLQGVLDLLVLEDDGFIVVDFKASFASDENLINRYKNQLKLYAYAGEKILNKKCKKMFIYKIFDAKVIEIN